MSGVKFETLVAPVCATVRDPRTKTDLDQDKSRTGSEQNHFENPRHIRTESWTWQSVDPYSTEKPKTGSFVTYHYICRDESGNRIDSTYDENAPIHAKIGSGNIIQVRFQIRTDSDGL